MVAIALYKGNLHKATGALRQLPMPTPTITPRYFQILIRRRLNTLSILQSTSNPNPGADPPDDGNNNVEDIDKRDSGVEGDVDQMDLDEEQIVERGKDLKEVRDDEKVLEREECSGKLIKESDALIEGKNGKDVEDANKSMVVVNPEPEQVPNKDIDIVAKEKRIKEVQEKLKVLNEKKHGLVQVLKQILNAEEELKRRNTQGTTGRQLPSLQVDNTNDSGSMTRLHTPRTVSDGNLGGDMDVGEADDAWNHNVRPGNVLRLSSTSPSSDSQLKKPASNAVPLASRTALGTVGSPSRFAPTGQQATTSNPPSVSVSGTNYIASSPSPAASGGTSVLRDGRLPSPWN